MGIPPLRGQEEKGGADWGNAGETGMFGAGVLQHQPGVEGGRLSFMESLLSASGSELLTAYCQLPQVDAPSWPPPLGQVGVVFYWLCGCWKAGSWFMVCSFCKTSLV